MASRLCYLRGCLFFCEKYFQTFYVCPTQTTRRRLSLQHVCFLEVISFKKKPLLYLFHKQIWLHIFKPLLF
ncbi:hypothetical protein HanRHA438_Chr10g0430551 [Helianthus annuus]|nr:hypothetical protein HanRHA438_Chr10g0430551 [Helianthus annuus]